MATKVLGQGGAIEQGKKYSGGIVKPSSTIRMWRGPKKDIKKLIAQVQFMGDWTYEETGPTATLTCTIQGIDSTKDPQPVETWELVPGVHEKDIMETDVFAVNAMGPENQKTVRDLMNDPPPKSTVFNNAWAISTFQGTAEQKAAALEVFLLMVRGTRSVLVFQPTLRRTRIVANSYGIKEANANVGRIISTGSLSSEVPGSFLISFDGPPFNKVPLDTLRYAYGWFKEPPTLQVAARNQVQLVQQWNFGLWPILLYDDPI